VEQKGEEQMDNKKIGDYITTLRKNRNLTQKDLANQLGVTDKAVSKWERGAGYPDISLLRPIADLLGTTVNELLEGEASITISEASSNVIVNALEYADHFITSKKSKLGKILATILSISLLIAVCTSVIVNVAVNQQLSWSLIVTASCIFSGCILLPPLVLKNRGLIYSLCLLTLLIIPFLAEIELATSGKVTSSGWVWGIGFPVSVTWLAIIWIILFLYKKLKLSIWFNFCICLLFCIPAQIVTNYIIDRFTDSAMDANSRTINTVSSVIFMLAASGICFIIGLNKRKK